jgi:hypothetical protein
MVEEPTKVCIIVSKEAVKGLGCTQVCLLGPDGQVLCSPHDGDPADVKPLTDETYAERIEKMPLRERDRIRHSLAGIADDLRKRYGYDIPDIRQFMKEMLSVSI